MVKAGLVLLTTAAICIGVFMAIDRNTREARAEDFLSRMQPILDLAATKPHDPETTAAANQRAVRMVESDNGSMHLIFYTEDADVCVTGLKALGASFELVIVNGEVARTTKSLTAACRTAAKPRIVARIKSHSFLAASPQVLGLP